MATPYELALNTPRWKRKSFEIKARHHYRCDDCLLRRSRLEVHHLTYEQGRAPWDYPDDNFAVLCRNCHEKRHHPPDSRGQLSLFTSEELASLMIRPSLRRPAAPVSSNAPNASRASSGNAERTAHAD